MRKKSASHMAENTVMSSQYLHCLSPYSHTVQLRILTITETENTDQDSKN